MSFLQQKKERQAAAARGELSQRYTGIRGNSVNPAQHVGPEAPPAPVAPRPNVLPPGVGPRNRKIGGVRSPLSLR